MSTTTNIVVTNNFIYGSDHTTAHQTTDAIKSAVANHTSILAHANINLPQSAPARILYTRKRFNNPLLGTYDLLYKSGALESVINHWLLTLATKGNMSALELLNGHIGVIDKEDLIQDFALGLLESNLDSKGGVYYSTITDCAIIKEYSYKCAYTKTSADMYAHKTRVAKRQYYITYTEQGEEEAKLVNVPNLAEECTDLANVLNNEDLRQFLTTYHGNITLAKMIIAYRAQGYTLQEITDLTDVYTLAHVKAELAKIQRAWKKLYAPKHESKPIPKADYSWTNRRATMDKIIADRDNAKREAIKAHKVTVSKRKISELEKFSINEKTYISHFNDKGTLADSVTNLDKKLADRARYGMDMLTIHALGKVSKSGVSTM